MVIAKCKVTKFIDIEPTVIPYQVPEDLDEETLYWSIKELLYDSFNAKYLEIISIDKNVSKEEYIHKYGGCINLKNTINKYYRNPTIPTHGKRDKDKQGVYKF